MNEIREVAMAYYARATVEEKQLAQQFFRTPTATRDFQGTRRERRRNSGFRRAFGHLLLAESPHPQVRCLLLFAAGLLLFMLATLICHSLSRFRFPINH
ncbi:hypothetical protein Pfo_016225, partial [Paulownia fortunei]